MKEKINKIIHLSNGRSIMKCPKCNEEMKELHPFLHHEKCENCGYEEEDIFIINEGTK